MSEPPRRRILIAGGSIGGLFAAVLLHRRGHDVTVVERVAEHLDSRGAGIVTHPELVQALAEAGLEPGDTLGVPVAGRRVFARDGSILAEMARPQVLTSWRRIWRLLRAALPDQLYRPGVTVQSCDEDGDAVRACLSDGTALSVECVVGADGINSTVRRALAPSCGPAYVGYVAWRGLVAETALSAETRAALFGHFGFALPAAEQMLGYPVPGPNDEFRTGERQYNFVWYRPAPDEAALAELFTDKDGRRAGNNIAPTAIRPDVIAAMRDAAAHSLAPPFAEVVAKTGTPFLQAIVDVETPVMTRGRVALLGDAAFVARPHVGMGVTKAAADAVALAHALEGDSDVQAALAGYAAERHGRGTAIVAKARALGRDITDAPAAGPRARAHAVMEGTAVG